MKQRERNLIRDLAIVAFSVFLAVALVKTGLVERALRSNTSTLIIESFFAGIFFTSVFTAAIATVALGEFAQNAPILLVSFFGALGALLGDMLIFRFVKDSVAEDIDYLVKKTGSERFFAIFTLKIFRWLIPFLGALIIASPLPDELGLAILGFSKNLF